MNDTLWQDQPALRAAVAFAAAGLPAAGTMPACDQTRTDWIAVITLAMEHAIAGLVHRGMTAAQPANVPRPIAETLARNARATAARNAAGFAEYRRLNAALEAASVPAIPLKGTWLCQRVYGDLGARPSRDIDFLIRPHDIDKALGILAACGYRLHAALSPRQLRATARRSGQLIIFRHDNAFAIEPHWALAPSTICLDIDHAGFWARARMQAVGDTALLTLAPEDEFLALCVHGFKEEWDRLKLLADLSAFTRAHPQLDWDRIASDAAQRHLRRLVLVAVVLMAEVFATRTPLLAAAQADPAAGSAAMLLQRLARAAGTPQRTPTASNIFEVSRIRLAMRERRLDRVRAVAATMSTPRDQHFQALPLPDVLFPAYYAVKPVHDYALLPLWTLLKRTTLLAPRRPAAPSLRGAPAAKHPGSR